MILWAGTVVQRRIKPRVFFKANAGPNTNGSQFFICLEKVGLPHAYTIFGEVTSGMKAVDAIAALPTKGEKPTQDAVINSVKVSEG
ncbi:MAG: peptidylprolyl isomerase [Acidimicrobiia bacterium]